MLCLLSVLSYTPAVHAAQSNSSNYGVSEVNFGSGGSLQSCSGSYCSKQSAGELTVGSSSSANYTARSGFNTDREEFLEVSVTGTTINFGVLESFATKFGSSTFSIRAFPAHGYNVIVDGFAPRSTSGNSIAAMSSATTSQIGVEQFGINLRQNTTPAVGADPVLFPDSTFAFGAAATGYNSPNNYKFVAGDTIASSPKGTGRTNYTLSIIANISTNTPSGSYSGRLGIIAVPTF
ncbi:MAG: exported protein of unknown function [Candidatus Saccharibacteria bacterium]|nr:exported protein of unknown function [Candidatus Saccharibacteria bacterium]